MLKNSRNNLYTGPVNILKVSEKYSGHDSREDSSLAPVNPIIYLLVRKTSRQSLRIISPDYHRFSYICRIQEAAR